MEAKIVYRSADESRYNEITSLLEENDLPASDIDIKIQSFIIAHSDAKLIGCIGLEIYPPHGLLRSLAVDKDFRNQGIAQELVKRLIAHCRDLDIQSLHLLTTTAKEYFMKKGFIEENRESAPDSIQSTKEFSFLCPSSSVYMVLRNN